MPWNVQLTSTTWLLVIYDKFRHAAELESQNTTLKKLGLVTYEIMEQMSICKISAQESASKNNIAPKIATQKSEMQKHEIWQHAMRMHTKFHFVM